jgi:AraC family ethanolamine operon transcriptional activator
MVWAVLPLSPERPFLINGRSAGPNTVAIYGEGALHEAANHAEVNWALVALQASLAERLLDLPSRSPILRPGAHAMLASDPEAWRRAVLLLRSAVEVAVQDPEIFEVEEARRSLRSSVLEVVQDLLTGAWSGGRPRILRSPPERQRLVRAIEDYLKANPGQTPTNEDLAAAFGASASRLRRAVRASFGISLQRYLLLRRLTLFRMALRSAASRGRSPREVALAYGFWHLRRLVRDYRAVFSEDLSTQLGEGDGQQQHEIGMLRP